ncbi:MAG: putative acyl esterase [Flavobacteriales bacterium]|jgi:predicted acyl esterase
MKTNITLLLTLTFVSLINYAQVILNGEIDNIQELSQKTAVDVTMADGTILKTDIYLPVFQDCVMTEINLGGGNVMIEIIPRNTQFVIYDTTNITAASYSLPIIFTRTPYKKASNDSGGEFFPFLGYGYALQDMRGRYESQGVYFPMFSDSWSKEPYHSDISIPMDVTSPTDANHALKHRDGAESVLYIGNSAYRIGDVNSDGIIDTILFCNGQMGMFGASALGNSQYQALADIPHSDATNPIKCMIPIVGANEHFNSTVFHNGVFRSSLTNGWVHGQFSSGVYDTLNGTDNSIFNSLHSPSDYNATTHQEVAEGLLEFLVEDSFLTSVSGSHPSSKLRADLDASQAPVDNMGVSDANGGNSRYENMNKPMYHLTGWWDIFINGQIETFNNARKTNPTVKQQLIIGPWAHQTIGESTTGDVTYPENFADILKVDYNNLNLSDSGVINSIYESDLLYWYRDHLGGEPFFIIPESQTWQNSGTNLIRIPAENYIIPYYDFLNYLGGQSGLIDMPVEVDNGGSISQFQYTLPILSSPLLAMEAPISTAAIDYFDNQKDIKMYITGADNDPLNTNVGNYWFATDSLPLVIGVTDTKFYLHQNLTSDQNIPTTIEGDLTYTADPNNPVITIGGNNMIPNVPGEGRKSQGSINLADPNYINLTMDRPDVLTFTTIPLTDTLCVIGFPKAGIYAKGNTTTHTTTLTDFDVMIRILDVYPDGREMLITEGVVNAKSRDYAKSIFDRDTNDNIILTNVTNDTYEYFEFDMLPLGHTFGIGHQLKFVVSSSNYPKYQSNPHLPHEPGEFFRWMPNSTETYNYQGSNLSAQNSDITYEFNPSFPNYINLPVVYQLPNEIKEEYVEETIFEVYPNPSNGIFSIKTDKIMTAVDVYSETGKLIRTISFSSISNTYVVDLSNLSTGIYFISDKATQFTQQVIITK